VNKRKLQDFSSWAKVNLEKQIEISLKKIGINSEKNINRSRIQGDITVIDGIETTFKKSFHNQREEIIHKIKSDGYDHSIEQFASTWFNRIIALRFMEVHDYFDHGFKLFPSESNTLPEILSKLTLVSEELQLDLNYCHELQDLGSQEALYRYVLFQQSNVLARALPMLFSMGLDYLEYFIPTPLLFGDTLINRLIEIDEADFKEDVEIIGWLYQFYVSFLREEIRKKKNVAKNDIPILSQVFTPNWIVKYMTENSLGRIWLESYPNSSLKSHMKYYIEEAEQSESVLKELESIRYKDVNVEDIKVIEPCSGSGHILTYLFDLLFQMYLEKGYSKKDIPALILNNNLYGLDIDQRATQLASFGLVMKARSIDNRFFDSERYVRPKVFEIIDSKSIINSKYNSKSYLDVLKDYNTSQWKGDNQLNDEELKAIKYIVDLFIDAKVIGSLLKVKPYKYLIIRKKLVENYKKNTLTDIFTSGFFDFEFKELLEILRIAHILSTKYDVMITNPPYMGISNIDENPKEYLKDNYPNSNTDMYSMFLEAFYLKVNGLISLVNPDSWMFLKSFEKLRSSIIDSSYIINMTHHGMGEFDAVVQTTAFVLRNNKLQEYNSVYYRLVDSKKKQTEFISKREEIRFIASNKKYIRIPGKTIAYWISSDLEKAFVMGTSLVSIAKTSQGMATGENNKFVRMWWEPNFEDSYLNSNSREESIQANKKWVPYNKGGAYRKWYGNNDSIVYFKDFGKDIASSSGSVIRNSKQYLIESITWGKIGSGPISFRYKPFGHVFDVAGTSIFADKQTLMYLLALCNSKVIQHILKATSPTLNYEVGQISNIPVIIQNFQIVNDIVIENIDIVKTNWDLNENSWDFKKHSLIGKIKLSEKFVKHDLETNDNFSKLKKNEEKLNEFFINLYELNDELSKDVEDKYVSISLTNKYKEIQSLISYLIGVLMGRYSLIEEGLIFAGGEFDFSRYGDYDVDQDGIIPIFPDLSFENGLVHRIIKLIKRIYGEEHYRDNIDFIADALGKKSNEISEETLNRYLNQDFYSDHIKTYQKRPIYWMFSSGNKQGFKSLIYLHRYNSITLAKMNASYFQPATTIIRTKISEIEKQIITAQEKEKIQLERLRFILIEQLNEAVEYGQVLDYIANKYLSIDLDDGVKVNYDKFQGIEISTSHGKVKKDLLVPIK
jgi:hypothetical protein